jgi:hypothetical protein
MKLLICAMTALASGAGMRTDAADILEMELRLVHAMGPGSGGRGKGASLLVDATRTGRRWGRVWAINADSRRLAFFTGCVTKAEVSSKRVVLDMLLRFKDVARVHLDMQQKADGTLAGTYTVTSPSETFRGKADGRVKPPRPPLPARFVPVQPGERPRVLFRRTDLPALKEKLKTPLGRVLFQKMGAEADADAIGAGIKYQLTGRPEFAEKARTFAQMQMAGRGGRYSSRTAAGRRPKQVALTYDLCHDVWPDDFKKTVREYLVKTAQDVIAGRGMGGNTHVSSNWWAKPYSALAFIGLALWGEKGPQPVAPPGPMSSGEEALFSFDVAEWKRLGKVNMDCQRIFETGRQMMYQHYREAVGTGGFRGECAHYGLKATEMPAEYAPCYRGMFGRDVSPYPDITHLLPRLVFCHIYPEPWRPFGQEGAKGEGKPVPLDINGWSQIWGNYFASLYPMTPEKWRPAMLWAWNRQLGITGPEGAAKLLESRQMDEHGTGYAATFFLGYPVGAAGRHPADCMPLTWQAPDMGYYGFRSGWKGESDFALHVYARSRSIGGWKGPNAGTFRLFGLGQKWNDSYSGRDIWPHTENGVLLPEDPNYVDGCGRVVHTSSAADGSGSVSIDLSDVSSATSGKLYSLYGGIRYPAAQKDSGIRALRALAIDYSGKCGAPCLFVLADRIRGGGNKVWTWNLGEADVLDKVKAAGDTFTIAKGDAVLRGTFVSPSGVKVEARVNEVTRTAYRGKKETRKIPSILATGDDDFFLVATISPAKDPPPEIRIAGAGLGAVATVGDRTVRFLPPGESGPGRIVISSAR